MSSWLTFVIGVIVGLLVGWLLDLFYRRRGESQSDLEPAAGQRQPEWAVPLPEEPAGVAAPAPAAVAGGIVAAEAMELTEPVPPEAEALALAEEPLPPAEAELPVEPELPVAPDEPYIAAAPVSDAAAPPEAEILQPVTEPEQAPGWEEVSERVAEVAETADETPIAAAAAAAHVASELPPVEEGLPPAAVVALAASETERTETEPAAAPDARDKLTLIEGIGPVYEAKLNAAGIYTFRQLVAAGPERLREIIQPAAWQRLGFDDWIEQARLFDEGKTEEVKALQERLFRRKA